MSESDDLVVDFHNHLVEYDDINEVYKGFLARSQGMTYEELVERYGAPHQVLGHLDDNGVYYAVVLAETSPISTGMATNERVMEFCSEEEYNEFLRTCPEFERIIVRNGIILIKYWFSVSDEEQEQRFQARITDPTKRWKLSPMDLESRSRWLQYSIAKDEMFKYTDIKQAPWCVVEADDKKRARLNCINHLLTMIPYKDLTPEPIELPPRKDTVGYVRPPKDDQSHVPGKY